MTPTFISDIERNEFFSLSKTIEAGDYAEALTMSKDMLERYPDNAYIYHNQIGAMYYLSENAYWSASRHYRRALELGFPADTCEENLWESAEDGFKFLIDGEEGFCSIMNTEDGTLVARNYTLVEEYKEAFPEGKYNDKADELLFIYDVFQPGVFNSRDGAVKAYNNQFPNGSYHGLLDELCAIYYK